VTRVIHPNLTNRLTYFSMVSSTACTVGLHIMTTLSTRRCSSTCIITYYPHY